MKKIVSILAIVAALISCQQDIQTNTPAFQAKKNDVFWRASDARVSVSLDGKVTITAINRTETLTLQTSSAVPGVYVLGTINQNNFASYTIDAVGFENYYDTGLYSGPVFRISSLLNGGSGYQANSSGAQTTGGSGSGLRVATQSSNGVITSITIVARGVGYRAGDLITIVGGNNNATFRVINIQQSNGEIEIQEVQNGLFTGTYKLNAVNEEGEVVTFSEGVFYKIPISTL